MLSDPRMLPRLVLAVYAFAVAVAWLLGAR